MKGAAMPFHAHTPPSLLRTHSTTVANALRPPLLSSSISRRQALKQQADRSQVEFPGLRAAATEAPSAQTITHSSKNFSLSPNLASQNASTFQGAISRLQESWGSKGLVVWLPHSCEVGAGAMNPATFLQPRGPEPGNVCYAEPSIRLDDSRYGHNPSRVQCHTPFQAVGQRNEHRRHVHAVKDSADTGGRVPLREACQQRRDINGIGERHLAEFLERRTSEPQNQTFLDSKELMQIESRSPDTPGERWSAEAHASTDDTPRKLTAGSTSRSCSTSTKGTSRRSHLSGQRRNTPAVLGDLHADMIKRATTAAELCQLLQVHGPSLRAGDRTHVLYKLALLGQAHRHEEPALSSHVRRPAARAVPLTSSHPSKRLRVDGFPSWSDHTSAPPPHFRRHRQSSDISSTPVLSSLEHLQLSQDMLQVLLHAAVPELELDLEPWDVSLRLWSLAELQLFDAAAFQALSERILTMVQRFKPVDCAHVMLAFGKMGHYHPQVLEELTQVILRQMNMFRPEELVHVTWGHARLGFCESAPLLEAVADRWQWELHNFSCQETALLLWSFATLRHRPSVRLLQRVEKLTKDRLPQLSPQDISNSCWAFLKLDYNPHSLLMALPQRAVPLLGSFKVQELSNLLWAYAQARLRVPTFLAELVAELHHRVEELDYKEVASAIWSLGLLYPSLPDSGPVRELALSLAASAEAQLGRYGSSALAHLAKGLAKLNLAPEELMQQLCRRAEQKLARTRPDDLTNLLYALAALKYHNMTTFYAVVRHLVELLEQGSRWVTRWHVVSVLRSCNSMGYLPYELISAANARGLCLPAGGQTREPGPRGAGAGAGEAMSMQQNGYERSNRWQSGPAAAHSSSSGAACSAGPSEHSTARSRQADMIARTNVGGSGISSSSQAHNNFANPTELVKPKVSATWVSHDGPGTDVVKLEQGTPHAATGASESHGKSDKMPEALIHQSVPPFLSRQQEPYKYVHSRSKYNKKARHTMSSKPYPRKGNQNYSKSVSVDSSNSVVQNSGEGNQ